MPPFFIEIGFISHPIWQIL